MAININASTSAGLQIASDTSGNIQFQTNGSNTVAIPSTIVGTVVADTATQTLTNKTLTSPTINGATLNTSTLNGGALTNGTAVASTSGTTVSFTGIPSWVKRITLMLVGVSTNGTSVPLIQLGTSSGFETSGYLGTGAGSGGSANYTAGAGIGNTWAATVIVHGRFDIVLQNAATNTWVIAGNSAQSEAAGWQITGSSKALAGTLDRIRLTTVNGTDAFDAGSVNIQYGG